VHRATTEYQEQLENQRREAFSLGSEMLDASRAMLADIMARRQQMEYRPGDLAIVAKVAMAGLEARDERFFFVLFNIGVMYAQMRDPRRSVDYFRTLLDRHPQRREAVLQLFTAARGLHQAIDEQPGFGERLVAACPELFDTDRAA